jgi:drug/metabolite transporter (DMT)-like permease
MGGKLKYYIILHLVVLVWGITGILGDNISMSADKITFYRTGISFLSLLGLGLFISSASKLTAKQRINLILTGAIVGLHWYSFFYSIKVSNVSIGVVCMSSSTLFTSILEPIIFKRPFLFSEFILSFVIIGGIVIIFGFESGYYLGIIFGLVSAFLAALFTVINGRFIATISSFQITKYEMLGGVLTLGIISVLNGNLDFNLMDVANSDWVFLLILGLVCTTAAFMISVWVMKYVTPFTVSMSVNMEPIYTIIIAVCIELYMGTSKEQMSWGFYLGGLIIIAAIFTNALIKKRANQKINKTILEPEG